MNQTERLLSVYWHELSGVRRLPHAILTPPTFDKTSKTCTGALYSSGGAIVIDSARPGAGGFRHVDPLSIDLASARLDGAMRFTEAIYGGHFFYAWGHFLLETLSCAVFIDDALDLSIPIVFQPWALLYENEWTQSFVDHVAPLAKVAFGNREVIITTKPVQFAECILPARLSALGRSRMFDPRVDAVYERIRKAYGSPDAPTRYLLVKRSEQHRRRLPAEGNIYERLLQTVCTHEMLAQAYPAAEQVKSFSEAAALVGFSGTVLHNSIFMSEGTTVVEIGDTPNSAPHRAQIEICAFRQQKYAFVPGFDKGQPRAISQICADVTAAIQLRGPE